MVLIEDGRITLDLKVDLPRPRVRGNAAFAAWLNRPAVWAIDYTPGDTWDVIQTTSPNTTEGVFQFSIAANALVAGETLEARLQVKDAAAGTIRKDFAISIGENTVHGSDSTENAAIEIGQFFPLTQIMT